MHSTDKPSFIVVGPPRTGTSWLHKVLESHATLPSPTKETRFFDLHFDRGFDWYKWHFPRARRGLVGEVAPTYFASWEAQERIAQTIPGVKLVFIFRHPVQRAVSLYKLKLAYGMYRYSFSEALRNDPELVNSGMYWTHLSRWRTKFPERQLLVTIYDDLVADPQSFVGNIAAFIGLDPSALCLPQAERVFSTERMTRPRNYRITRTATACADWCKARRLDHLVASVRESSLIKMFLGGGGSLPQIPTKTMDDLASIFQPEIDGLEAYLGRDLDHWRTSTNSPALQNRVMA